MEAQHRTTLFRFLLLTMVAVVPFLVTNPVTAKEKSKLADAKHQADSGSDPDPDGEPSSPAAIEAFSAAAKWQNDGKFTDAIKSWQAFLKKYGRDPLAGQAEFYLGICHLELQQHNEAAAHFAAALKSDDNESFVEDAFVNLGWCHYWQGLAGDKAELARGAVVFRDMLKRFPKTEAADQSLFYMGECLYHLDKKEAAIDAYARLAKEYPKSAMRPDALYALGVAQLEQDKFEDAHRSFNECIDHYPAHPLHDEIKLRDADALMAWGKYAEAEKIFAAVAKVPNFASADHAIYRQGYCAAKLKKHAAAAKIYASLVNDHPKSPFAAEAMIAAGRAFYSVGDTDTATAWLDKAIAQGGTHATEAQHWKTRIAKGEPADDELAKSPIDIIAETTSTQSPDAQSPSAQPGSEQHATLPAWDTLTSSDNTTQADKSAAAESQGRTPVNTNQVAEDPANSDEWSGDLPILNGLDKDRSSRRNDTKSASQNDEGNALPENGTASASRPANQDNRSIQGNSVSQNRSPLRQTATDALADAVAAMNGGQFQESIRVTKTFLDQSPDDALAGEILAIQAESWQRDGRDEQAAKTYDQLFSQYAKNSSVPQWALRYANVLSKQAKHAAVITVLEPHIESFRNEEEQGEVWLLLGTSQLKEKQYEAAATSLGTASRQVATSSQAANAMLQLAVAQQKLQHMDQAKATLKTIIDKFGDHPSAHRAKFELAELHFDAGQWEEALEQYDRVIAESSKSSMVPFCLFGKGWALLRSDRAAAAVEPLSRLLNDYPDHELAMATLQTRAMCHQHAGDFVEGLVDIARLMEREPVGDALADALYVRGLCQSGLKQHKEATATLRTILEKHPQYAENDRVLYELGWVAQNKGDSETATQWFATLAKRYPESPAADEALFRVGNMHFARGEYAKALEYHQKVENQISDPNMRAECIHKIGWSHFQARDYPAAEAAFRKQLALKAEREFEVEGKFMLAESLLNQKKFGDAMQLYQGLRTVEEKTETVATMTLLHGSRCALENRDWTTTIDWGKELVAKFPKSQYVRRAKLQSGIALAEKRETRNAIMVYEALAKANEDAVGAEARYRLGQLHFNARDFEQALTQFDQIVTGYQAADLTKAMNAWKPQAALAAGRSAAALANASRKNPDQTQYLARAQKYLQFVMTNFPESPAAAAAQEELGKVNAYTASRR